MIFLRALWTDLACHNRTFKIKSNHRTYGGIHHGRYNVSECEQLCLNQSLCQSFDYNRIDESCWLTDRMNLEIYRDDDRDHYTKERPPCRSRCKYGHCGIRLLFALLKITDFHIGIEQEYYHLVTLFHNLYYTVKYKTPERASPQIPIWL